MLNGRKLVAFCGKASCFVRGKCFAEDVSLGFGEDLGCSLRETVRAMAPRGWIAATPDQHPLEAFDAFVFQDMPRHVDPVWTFACQHARPRYLVVAENPLIDRLNAEYDRYREFNRVFTFEDEAVRKYHCTKLNYVFDFSRTLADTPSFEDRRLAVMISSRVKKLRPGLVSYERVRTIDYYEKNHPDQFDLFGIGWDVGVRRLMTHPKLYRALQTMRLANLVPSTPCRVWKGTLERKLPTISRYRFSYCYENTTSISGYVTEKLFDVLMAGTVPVYLGHPSARNVFPSGLYIDRADFKDDADLYAYLSSLSDKDWMSYREVAREYLSSRQAHAEFSVAHYVDLLLSALADDIG